VTDRDLTLADQLSQPGSGGSGRPAILRSLVIGDQLWTLSKVGLQATGLSRWTRWPGLPLT
jgi:hypothetical protein